MNLNKNNIVAPSRRSNKLLRLRQENRENYYDLGFRYFEKRNYAEAEKHLKICIAHNPHHARAYYLLGRCHIEQGRLNEAIQELETSIGLPGAEAEAHFYLGYSYNMKRRSKKAIKLLSKYTLMRPDDWTGYIQLSMAFCRSNDFLSALHNLEIAKTLNPSSYFLYYCFALCNFLRGKIREARTDLQLATELNPNSGESWELLGMCYYKLKEYRLAISSLGQALKLGLKTSGVYSYLGRAYCLTEQGGKAIAFLRKAVHLDPTDRWAKLSLGLALLFEEHAFQEVINLFSSLKQAFRKRSQASSCVLACYHFAVGTLHLEKEDYVKAKHNFLTSSAFFKKAQSSEIAKFLRLFAKATSVDMELSSISGIDSLVELRDILCNIGKEYDTLFSKKYRTVEKETDLSPIALMFLNKALMVKALASALRFEKTDAIRSLNELERDVSKALMSRMIPRLSWVKKVIRRLRKFNSLEEVPKDEEQDLLALLRPLFRRIDWDFTIVCLNNELRVSFSQQIRNLEKKINRIPQAIEEAIKKEGGRRQQSVINRGTNYVTYEFDLRLTSRDGIPVVEINERPQRMVGKELEFALLLRLAIAASNRPDPSVSKKELQMSKGEYELSNLRTIFEKSEALSLLGLTPKQRRDIVYTDTENKGFIRLAVPHNRIKISPFAWRFRSKLAETVKGLRTKLSTLRVELKASVTEKSKTQIQNEIDYTQWLLDSAEAKVRSVRRWLDDSHLIHQKNTKSS